MKITISNRQFTTKPIGDEEIAEIHSDMFTTTTTIGNLINMIENGQSFSPAVFKNKRHTCNSFKFAECFCIDIDQTTKSVEEISKYLKYSFYYPSFKKENSYHFVITFDGVVTTCDDFTQYVTAILLYLESNGIDGIDYTCNQAQRIYFGTNKKCYMGNGFYTMQELDDLRASFPVEIDKSTTKIKKVVKTAKNSLKMNLKSQYSKTIQDLLVDGSILDSKDLFNKYVHKYQFIEESYTDKLADRVSYWHIKKYKHWDKENNCWKKYKHGDHRRDKMFKILTIVQQIKNDINVDELLFNALMQRSIRFDNKDNKLDNGWLYSVCKCICDHKDFQMETNTRIVTNKQLCRDCNISYQKAAGEYKHNELVKAVKELYNDNLSIKENLELINNNGLKISKSTLYSIINNNKEDKQSLVMSMYDCSLSLNQNLKMINENGIKISKPTLIKYLRVVKNSKTA